MTPRPATGFIPDAPRSKAQSNGNAGEQHGRESGWGEGKQPRRINQLRHHP